MNARCSHEVCVDWVRHMIANGINVVAMSFGHGVVGHVALFPFDDTACELFVVVAKDFQNTGIGTELTQAAVQLSYERGFEKIWLDVESTNLRARHVYKRCGFDYVAAVQSREIEMECDLRRFRSAVSVVAEQIMKRAAIVFHPDESCRAAMEVFLTHGESSLPVVEKDGQLLGVLSEADLLQPLNLDKHVRDVFTQQTPTADSQSSLMRLLRLFQTHAVGCIPIVDFQGKLQGTVSRKEILAHYAEAFPPAIRESG